MNFCKIFSRVLAQWDKIIITVRSYIENMWFVTEGLHVVSYLGSMWLVTDTQCLDNNLN